MQSTQCIHSNTFKTSNMTYTGPLYTIYEEVDVLNKAGVPHGDYIMVKSAKGYRVKIQMPPVPKGEFFRIRIPLEDPVLKTRPCRVVLNEDLKLTDGLTNGAFAVWLSTPTVDPPRTPTKKTPPALPPRPRKQRPQ